MNIRSTLNRFDTNARTKVGLWPTLPASIVAVGMIAPVAPAAPIEWKPDATPNAGGGAGGGEDNNGGNGGFYNDVDHWAGGAVPATGDDLKFNFLALTPEFEVLLDADHKAKNMSVLGETRLKFNLNNFKMRLTEQLLINGLPITAGGAKMTLVNGGADNKVFQTKSAIIGQGTGLAGPPDVGTLLIDGGGVFRKVTWVNTDDAILGEKVDSEGILKLTGGAAARIDGHLTVGKDGKGFVTLETKTALSGGTASIGSNGIRGLVTMIDDTKWNLTGGGGATPALTIGKAGGGVGADDMGELHMINNPGAGAAVAGHPILTAKNGVNVEKGGKITAGAKADVGKVKLAGVIKTDKLNGKKVKNGGSIEFGGILVEPSPINGGDGGVAGLPDPFEQGSRLTVRGDYEQTFDGLLTVRIGMNDNGTLGNDQLHVITDAILGGGTAILGGGTLSVAFGDTNGFSPSQLTAADYFVVLYAQEAILSQFTFAPIDLGSGKFLEARYRDHLGPQGGQKVVLRVVDTVPAPGALALLGLAGLIGASRRRR
jgi:hypothetical protein